MSRESADYVRKFRTATQALSVLVFCLGCAADPQVVSLDQKDPSVKEVVASLQGRWRMVSLAAPPDVPVRRWETPVDVYGDVMCFRLYEDDTDRAQFRLDPNHEPPWIDWAPVHIDGTAGSRSKGIYRLRKNELRMAISFVGYPRPGADALEDGHVPPNVLLMVLQR